METGVSTNETPFRRFVRFLLAVGILVCIIIALQQGINYLSYDVSGPSRLVIQPLVGLGLEEPLARALYWYVLQIGFSLVLIRLIIRKDFREVGFTLQNGKSSTRFILWFIIIYTLTAVLAWFGIYKIWGLEPLLKDVGLSPISYIVKDVALFGLLPGPGEEPLFRVFVIQFILMVAYNGKTELSESTKWVLIIVSSFLFSSAHVFVLSFFPLQLKYDMFQLVIAFILGLYYSFSYLYTKSILSAVVCHNYSDLIVRVGTYLIFSLAG